MPVDTTPIAWSGADPGEEALVGRCVGLVRAFEDGIGKDFRENCNRRYRQYRGFRQFSDSWEHANGRNDRDGLLYDAKKSWGAHLHIPLSFRTIETIVPKAIANAPKGIVVPLDEQWRHNVEGLRILLLKQQEQINIDLALQAVMRAGRIYGLGVGKSYWRREVVNRRRMERSFFKGGYAEGPLRQVVQFDDPFFEDVDVFDFMWDERASDMRTAEWACHRIWMSAQAVNRRVEEGVWNTPSAAKLTTDEVGKLGGDSKRYDEVWRDRMEVSGFSSAFRQNQRGDQPHELLEFHDGERVLTVLDRQVLVQDAENPCCGSMPFQIYRPTPANKMMVGIGDLEPLEDLQRELDTLRSQRRDLVTMTLAAGFLYDPTMIRREDLVFGPNLGIPVRGDVNEAFKQLQVRDVPGSGYQEEASIRTDIEAVSGMADALDNTPGGTGTTATEASLMQASLGRRIELGARRFEIEVPREVGRTFIYLDQRMISKPRPAMLHPEDGVTPEEAANGVGAYKAYPMGPAELEGDFEYEVDGGSMAAKNIPQERADAAQMANTLLGNPMLDRGRVLEGILERMGIKHPKTWMRQGEPPLPAAVLPILKAAGIDPNLLEQAVIRARTIENPEGPNVEQVTSLMGGATGAQAGAAPSTAAVAPEGAK